MGQDSGSSSGNGCNGNGAKFKQAIAYDLAATVSEMVGAVVYKSIVLSGNSGIGVLDAVMLLVNYLGWKLEKKHKDKVGQIVATMSDVMFAVAYFVAAGFGAFYLVKDAKQPIHGPEVLIFAMISLGFTILSAVTVPKDKVNGQSARFKMWLSVGAGGAAIINGYLVYLFGYRWIEQVTSIAVGTAVVVAVILRLRHLWGAQEIGLFRITPRVSEMQSGD